MVLTVPGTTGSMSGGLKTNRMYTMVLQLKGTALTWRIKAPFNPTTSGVLIALNTEITFEFNAKADTLTNGNTFSVIAAVFP